MLSNGCERCFTGSFFGVLFPKRVLPLHDEMMINLLQQVRCLIHLQHCQAVIPLLNGAEMPTERCQWCRLVQQSLPPK